MAEVKLHRPVNCYFCGEQMYYDGDERHEPEAQISWGDRAADYAHQRCLVDAKALTSTQKEKGNK